MPLLQNNVLPALNEMLSRDNISTADRELFALEEGTFNPSDTELSPNEQAALANMPRAIRYAVKGAITAAIDEQAEVNLVWAPGYDHEVQVWDCRSVPVHGEPTPHVVTILLRSPYPAES